MESLAWLGPAEGEGPGWLRMAAPRPPATALIESLPASLSDARGPWQARAGFRPECLQPRGGSPRRNLQAMGGIGGGGWSVTTLAQLAERGAATHPFPSGGSQWAAFRCSDRSQPLRPLSTSSSATRCVHPACCLLLFSAPLLVVDGPADQARGWGPDPLSPVPQRFLGQPLWWIKLRTMISDAKLPRPSGRQPKRIKRIHSGGQLGLPTHRLDELRPNFSTCLREPR